MDYIRILHLLQCPQCEGDLSEGRDELICNKNSSHRYPVKNGIVRFVNFDNNVEYNRHWRTFSKNPISQIKLAQARNFVDWFLGTQASATTADKVFLDVGCGDGNHLHFLPADSIKIALDYSMVVDLVASRFNEPKNLFVIQADTQQLPFKAGVIDYVISYSCLNCLPSPQKGFDEVTRVLKTGGLAGVWGYGTDSRLVLSGLNFSRKLYRLLTFGFLRKAFVYSMIPSLLFVRNSTNIRPGQNSLAECAEIISTNLSPEHLYIFRQDTWQDFSDPDLEYIEDYELFCGQKFRKR